MIAWQTINGSGQAREVFLESLVGGFTIIVREIACCDDKIGRFMHENMIDYLFQAMVGIQAK
jgi:hypothetical protein